MSTGRLRVTCKSTILGPHRRAAGRIDLRANGRLLAKKRGRKRLPGSPDYPRIDSTEHGRNGPDALVGALRIENGRGCAGFFGGHPERCRTQPISRTTLASTADRGVEVRPQPARLRGCARACRRSSRNPSTRWGEVSVGRDGEARGPDDPSPGRPGRVRRKHHARSDRVLRERRTLYRDPGGRRPQRRRATQQSPGRSAPAGQPRAQHRAAPHPGSASPGCRRQTP